MSELMERAQYAFHGRHADLTEKKGSCYCCIQHMFIYWNRQSYFYLSCATVSEGAASSSTDIYSLAICPCEANNWEAANPWWICTVGFWCHSISFLVFMLASCSTEYFFSFNSADDFLSGQSNVYLRDVHIFVCNRLYAVVLKPCIVNLFLFSRLSSVSSRNSCRNTVGMQLCTHYLFV